MCRTADINEQKCLTRKQPADNAGTEEYEQVCKYRPGAQIVANYCGKGEEVHIV